MKRVLILFAVAIVMGTAGVAHARPPMMGGEGGSSDETDAQFVFQNFGADPETAKWAVWAMKYQPSSRCAISAWSVYGAYSADMKLYPGGGEGMVVDHICEPAGLKHDALTIPPFTSREGDNERAQWGVTNEDRAKALNEILKRQEQAKREYRKNLRPPAYLTSPNSKNFVDQCRFVELGFDSLAEANEAGPGEVHATCLFALGDDNYWRAKGCHLVPEKGTSQAVMDASKKYLSSACWAKDDFHTELDKNGVGTKTLKFSLGDE